MTTQHLTAIFKLHNPSAHKRQVMNYALEQYTLAYQDLLNWAKEHEAQIAQEGKYVYTNRKGEIIEKYTGKSIAKMLPRVNAAVHGSVKDSLIQDAAGNLASYFALIEAGESPSFPTSRNPSPSAFPNALDDFGLVGLEDYDYYKDRLTKVARGSVRPLFFSRCDHTRNACLLYDVRKDRYFALMHLLPAKHTLGKPLPLTEDNLIRLDTGEVVQKSAQSKTAILAPLELGNNGWQIQKFLKPAMDAGGRIRTAHLVHDNGDYFLHVAFAFDCPPPYTPCAYLGIDRGVLFNAAYGLVNSKGVLIELGHLDDDLRALQIKHGREREHKQHSGKAVTKRHYRTKAYDNILHSLVNVLIEKALKHKAQIVLEDLNVQVKGNRVKSRFKTLERFAEYKCKLEGVPLCSVFSAWSSYICHRCGEKGERRGYKGREFFCPGCGLICHSDDNAAVNIARRALYRKADWKNHFEFHKSFANVTGLDTE